MIKDIEPRYRRISYKPTKAYMQFRIVNVWADTHKCRVYMHLTRVCRLVRQEFCPLYPKVLSINISPQQLGKPLRTFGLLDSMQEIGAFISMARQNPLHNGGLL
jgi:hypothetical protein